MQNLNDEKLFKLVEEYFGGTHYAVGDMVLHNETGHCHPAYSYRAFAQEVIDVALKDLVMDVRCEGCGYMTHHREHMGCVRAAKQHTQPAHRLAEKLRNAYDSADDIGHNDLKLAAMELESLHARVQELEAKEAKPAAPLNVWQQAIDAELVSTHLGIAHNDATFEDAQKAIRELICWHIDVATDPRTNGGKVLFRAAPAELTSMTITAKAAVESAK